MGLDSKITKEIIEFVKIKPRSIQEISIQIDKNWRTTERYVEKIKEETGSLDYRIFREGTRGALKIVFFVTVDSINSNSYREELYNRLMNDKWDIDFTPLDIYQVVEEKKKSIVVEGSKDPELIISESQDLIKLLNSASKQILIFSGNLTWINAKQGDKRMIDIIKQIAKRNIPIKIISRVSLIGHDNIEKLLEINKDIGKEIIEIRHRYHSLRAIIIDEKIIRFREIKNPEFYKENELKEKIGIFYDIFDKDYVEWFIKIFYKMFTNAISAKKRLESINEISKKIN